MRQNPLKTIYTTVKPVKHVVDSVLSQMPDSIRFGRGYARTHDFLVKSEQWSAEDIIRYQSDRIRRIVDHAIATVPFYQRWSVQHGVRLGSIRAPHQLKSLPYVCKDQMRDDTEEFVSSIYDTRGMTPSTTGGSSGIPLRFYRLNEYSAVEWAFVTNLWSRVGYTNADWRVLLRGPVVETSSAGRHWEFRKRSRELILSTFHMTEENLFEYYTLVKQTGFRFIHCHTSSGFILAEFMKRNNLVCPLKAVLCTSESIYPFQRTLMEEVFRCRVYSFYGNSEQAVLAGECEKSTSYHIQPEYGYVEIINDQGKEATMEGEIGEIVATGFINEVMPFIRYRTGDYAQISVRKCECGRNHRLISRIEGREYEYVVTADDRVISLTSLIYGQHFAAFSRMRKMQLYQERKGELEIRIEKGPDFVDADVREIEDGIMKCVLHDMQIHFAFPEQIPLTARGKHHFLVQKVPIDLLRSIAAEKK